MRVIGRLHDLGSLTAAGSPQRLDAVLPTWSLAGNDAWLVDGAARREPFVQISPAAAGTVLAWEIERLHALGYARVGPYWLPAAWWHDGDGYRRFVRLIAQHLLTAPDSRNGPFVQKALAELEPLLAMWPHVLLLPTSQRLSLRELIVGRAFAVHPLGVVERSTWADGRMCSPADFFCHDVDHARFKLREDLLVRGVAIDDPYVDGSTLDPATGTHRCIGARLAAHATKFVLSDPAATALALRLLTALDAEPDRELAAAAEWLVFEMVHEKSLPLAVAPLRAACGDDRHVIKLQQKAASGFFGITAPHAAVVAALPAARRWLPSVLDVEARSAPPASETR